MCSVHSRCNAKPLHMLSHLAGSAMAREIQPEPSLQVRRNNRVLGGRPELGLLSLLVGLPHLTTVSLRDRTMASIERILYKGRVESPGEHQEESTD